MRSKADVWDRFAAWKGLFERQPNEEDSGASLKSACLKGESTSFFSHKGWDYIDIDKKGREIYNYRWGKMEHAHWRNLEVA